MDAKKRTSYLLLIIGILVLALAGAIGYIVGDLNSDSKKPNSVSNNDEVMQEIEELKMMYDSKIAEKTTSFKELKEEQAKVESLMYELEKTKSDANSLVKYKTQYQQLEAKMRVLVNEIVALKSGKNTAVAKAKSTQLSDNTKAVKTTPAFTKKETPVSTQKEVIAAKKETPKSNVINQLATSEPTAVVQQKAQPVQPKVEDTKVEELKVSGLKAAAYITKSSGKLEETTSAGRTKMIRVSFAVNGYSGKKHTYYIQVINSKNNVMGKKITEFFDDKSLTYSFAKTVDLSDGGTVNVSQDFSDADFEKGTYFINIFDRSKLVGNSSVTLK